MPVQSQDSERSCICVFGVSIWPLSVILFIGFWNCSNSVVIFFSFFSFYFHIRQKMVILVDFKVRFMLEFSTIYNMEQKKYLVKLSHLKIAPSIYITPTFNKIDTIQNRPNIFLSRISLICKVEILCND